MSIPQEKLSALHVQLAQTLKETKLSPKFLASITGKIISIVARIMTRGLYALINACQTWYEVLEISDDAKSDLYFWSPKFNGQNIWMGPSVLRGWFIPMHSASNTGYVGYTVQHSYHIAHGLWLPEEVGKSST